MARVLPVVRADGTPAALKLQPVDDETAGEPTALRTWDGDGAVRLLDNDEDSGTMLLERLDATRPLEEIEDDDTAVQILAELLARLVATPAPKTLRRLHDIATAMHERTERAILRLRDPAEQRMLRTCAAAVAELRDEAGDRLLHWDLHYGNILAGQREPWLAIDPKPLAGDPGFELLPALTNRWEHVRTSGDVRRRFDRLTDVAGIDRQRAVGWTLGRILQNALWDIENGGTTIEANQIVIASAIGAYTFGRPAV